MASSSSARSRPLGLGRHLLSSIFFVTSNLLVFFGGLTYSTTTTAATNAQHNWKHQYYAFQGLGFVFMMSHVLMEASLDWRTCPRDTPHGRYAAHRRLPNLLVSWLIMDAAMANFIGTFVLDSSSFRQQHSIINTIQSILWCLSGILTLFMISLRQHCLDVLANMLFAIGTIGLLVAEVFPSLFVFDNDKENASTATNKMEMCVNLLWIISGVLYVISDLQRWMNQEQRQQHRRQPYYLPIVSPETPPSPSLSTPLIPNE